MNTASAFETSIDNTDVLSRPDEAAALSYIESDEATLANVTAAPDTLQFWESEHTRPDFQTGSGGNDELVAATESYLGKCMRHPYLPVSEIRAQQFARIKELVELAYRDIPVYRAKYDAAGFKPKHLRDFEDIQKIPVITKPELVAAFPDQCVNKNYKSEDLFPTRSSGSSGQTLLIRVDYDAILTDTIQGVRQFAMQSGGNYQETDLLTHVYTVPWWFDSFGGKWLELLKGWAGEYPLYRRDEKGNPNQDDCPLLACTDLLALSVPQMGEVEGRRAGQSLYGPPFGRDRILIYLLRCRSIPDSVNPRDFPKKNPAGGSGVF